MEGEVLKACTQIISFWLNIECSASGNSTLKAPLNGWGDPRLSDIFSRRRPRDTRVQPNPSLQPTRTSTIVSHSAAASSSVIVVEPTSSATSAPEHRKLSGGAIAGVIIACVVACVIGGYSVYIFYKRKRTKPTSQHDASIDSQPDPTPWNKAELEDHQLQEIEDTQRPLPELPEEGTVLVELPSHHTATELRDTSQSPWTRVAIPPQS